MMMMMMMVMLMMMITLITIMIMMITVTRDAFDSEKTMIIFFLPWDICDHICLRWDRYDPRQMWFHVRPLLWTKTFVLIKTEMDMITFVLDLRQIWSEADMAQQSTHVCRGPVRNEYMSFKSIYLSFFQWHLGSVSFCRWSCQTSCAPLHTETPQRLW